MRILHVVLLAAAAALATSCGDRAGPSGPEPGPDPVGIWDVTVSGLRYHGVSEPCTSAWIMAIEATDTGPVPLVSTKVPDNASLLCDQGEPIKEAGIERGSRFLVHRSGDTVTLLSAITSDTFVVAQFTDSLTLTGRLAGPDPHYVDATFQATRRSDSADPNRALYSFSVFADWPVVMVGDTVRVRPNAYDAYFDLIPDPPVAWTAKAPQVATLSADGLLHAIQPGQQDILAVLDTFVSGTGVAVLPLPASLAITSAPTSLTVPRSGDVRAVARDSDGTERCCVRLDWTSSDPAVATVSGHGDFGTVTSVGPGTVTITARLVTLTTSVTFDVH